MRRGNSIPPQERGDEIASQDGLSISLERYHPRNALNQEKSVYSHHNQCAIYELSRRYNSGEDVISPSKRFDAPPKIPSGYFDRQRMG